MGMKEYYRRIEGSGNYQGTVSGFVARQAVLSTVKDAKEAAPKRPDSAETVRWLAVVADISNVLPVRTYTDLPPA